MLLDASELIEKSYYEYQNEYADKEGQQAADDMIQERMASF